VFFVNRAVDVFDVMLARVSGLKLSSSQPPTSLFVACGHDPNSNGSGAKYRHSLL